MPTRRFIYIVWYTLVVWTPSPFFTPLNYVDALPRRVSTVHDRSSLYYLNRLYLHQ